MKNKVKVLLLMIISVFLILPVSLMANEYDTSDIVWAGTEKLEPDNSINLFGVGGLRVEQTTGIGTFYGLAGRGVNHDIRFNKIAIQDITVSVYDDIGTLSIAEYENEVPIATTQTTEPFLFNDRAEYDYQQYRNFKIDIEGFVGRDRDLVFIVSKEGLETRSYQAFLWPVINYSVTFDSNGGSEVNELTGLLLNSKINNPEVPQKEGYTFKGWYKDNDTFNELWDFENDVVTENTTLYAKWEPLIYSKVTINFLDTLGNKLLNSITLSGLSGTKFNVDIQTIKGYTFNSIINITHLGNLEYVFTDEDMILNVIYTKDKDIEIVVPEEPVEPESPKEVEKTPNTAVKSDNELNSMGILMTGVIFLLISLKAKNRKRI